MIVTPGNIRFAGRNTGHTLPFYKNLWRKYLKQNESPKYLLQTANLRQKM